MTARPDMYVYIYFDEEIDPPLPYYFDPCDGSTYAEVPEGVMVLDPGTLEVWKGGIRAANPDRHLPDHPPPDQPDSVVSDRSAEPVIDISDAVARFVPSVGPTTFTDRVSFTPSADAPYLPSDIMNELWRFKMTDYAKQFFRQHRAHTFQRKQISIEVLTEFTAEPLQEPLLIALDPKAEKLAIQCFKWILIYTGVETQKNPATYANKIVAACQPLPVLRDEVMFQLMKQTQNNPNPVWLQKTWELFLIIVTFFPSLQNSEIWIKSHFSRHIRHPTPIIADLAQFCYIRFAARCAAGKPLESPGIGYIQSIPMQFQVGRQQFGSSIYEQIWNQRRSVRRLPIPFIVHHMADHMLRKGCEQTEGLFRLPGNLKKVEQMAEETNKGRDAISPAPMNDIASLFKKWFRDLPDPVVNMEFLPKLRDAYDDKTYVQFAESLPRAHLLTLMYLVGFLQRLVKSEAATLMPPKNLAIVFGPNIVQPNDTNEAVLKLFADISIELLTTLIQQWDTSPMYPLDPDLLLEG